MNRPVGPGRSEDQKMVTNLFKEKLERYDDRFEITGEILLDTKEGKAELKRVLFAWTLYNKEDPSSIEDMVLVLEGSPDEVAKILRSIGAEVETVDDSSLIGLMFRMHKDLVNEVKGWAKDDETESVPSFLMGKGRMDKIFDFANYDLLTRETI